MVQTDFFFFWGLIYIHHALMHHFTSLIVLLIKVLIHPGHGKYRCCVAVHLSFKRLLHVFLTGGELQSYKLCVGVSGQSHLGQM